MKVLIRFLTAHLCRSALLLCLQNKQLVDLQITNLLGEGGFAKVFRGLWRGLTVGIKVSARVTVTGIMGQSDGDHRAWGILSTWH